MLGVFEIIVLCLFSLFAGIIGTLLVRFIIEIYLINNDIEELNRKIEENREKREQIEKEIKRLEQLEGELK